MVLADFNVLYRKKSGVKAYRKHQTPCAIEDIFGNR